MKILHFSDIHAGVPPKGVSWLFDKRIFGTATQTFLRRKRQDLTILETLRQIAEDCHPDAVLCTGDLTAVSAPREFAKATQAVMPIFNTAPAGIYVPGNHDSYVKRTDAMCAREDARRQLNFPTSETQEPPWLRTFGNIRMFLLDAALPMPPWKSGGTAPKHVLDAMEQTLSETRQNGEIRIFVSHFPLYSGNGSRLGWRKRISNDETIRKWVDNGWIDLCLCGHVHTPYTYRRGAFIQFCPGSITLNRHYGIIETGNAPDDIDVTCVSIP